MRLVNGLIPPGGYHYYEGDVKLIGSSEKDIISIIQQYRAANNLPQGDPTADYLSYVCGRYPQNCHAKVYYHETSPVPASRRDELFEDVRNWATNLLASQKPISLVSDEEAERRAKICQACPKNFTWKTKTCAPCVQAADSVCTTIRQAKDTYTSARIGGCLACRHDNRTAVFLDTNLLNSVESIPSTCWIK
jgi:hypothetical protein